MTVTYNFSYIYYIENTNTKHSAAFAYSYTYISICRPHGSVDWKNTQNKWQICAKKWKTKCYENKNAMIINLNLIWCSYFFITAFEIFHWHDLVSLFITFICVYNSCFFLARKAILRKLNKILLNARIFCIRTNTNTFIT